MTNPGLNDGGLNCLNPLELIQELPSLEILHLQ